MRRTLLQLFVLAGVLALAEAYLAAMLYPGHALTFAAYPMVGLAFVATGCIATSRRPYNPTGSLLIVTGALVMVAALSNVDEPRLVRVATLFAQLPIAGFLHLVLAFPSGRLVARCDVALVVAGYLLLTTLQLPATFPDTSAFDDVRSVALLAAFGVLGIAIVRVVLGISRTGRLRERRAVLAVACYGIGMLIFFPFSARLLAPWFGLDDFQRFSLQMAFFVVAPFVYAAGIVRGFGRAGELAELTGWLATASAGRRTLRDALAAVLGDPSLEVLFTTPDGTGVIDADGRPAEIASSPARGREDIRNSDGTFVATLVYDRTLLADPAIVRQAGGVAALALQREGLQAELLAEREALRASRARVVEIGDMQRRQFAQDLHDVLQSRLTLAALHAGTLAADSPHADADARSSAEALRLELDALIDEFRTMVHGVMPALLLERGLDAAVEELVDRQPVPTRLRLEVGYTLPPVVSTTAYFILAEAIANAVRHAKASCLDVRVCQGDGELVLEVRDDGVGGAAPSGAGLRGIADRVDALDGRFTVDSPAGAGTVISVVLPCVS